MNRGDTMEKGSMFRSTQRISKGLMQASKVAVRNVLGVKTGEKVLIITNPDHDVSQISMAVYDAVLEASGTPTLMYQPVKTQLDFAEQSVLDAIASRPDIVLSISKEKLGKDPSSLKKPFKYKKKEFNHIFTYLLARKEIRSFWSPSVTSKMFAKTVPIDYPKLRNRCQKLADALTKAIRVQVTAPGGTDVEIGLKKREAYKDDGDFREPGTGGNLPCGEVYISPQLGTTNGKIVFDGSISSHSGIILVKKPITANFKDGYVSKITGDSEAKELRTTIARSRQTVKKMVRTGEIPAGKKDEYILNSGNLGELGIGLNERAGIVGNMLEDEKVIQTCHFAIGANYDEDAPALIHLDGLVRKPTVTAFMKGGKEVVLLTDGKLR